jgi:hypothetical protein
MFKVYKIPPIFIPIFSLLILFILFISLPLFLVLAFFLSAFLIGTKIVRSFFSKKPTHFVYEDSNITPVIHNKEIGTYRIKQHPHDPDIIEVIDDSSRK